MSNSKAPGKVFHAPERVVERGRGCWNCKHFNNGEMAIQHYQTRTSAERAGLANALIPSMGRLGDDDGSVQQAAADAGRLIQQGFTTKQAANIALAKQAKKNPAIQQVVAQARQQDARFHQFTRMIQQGAIGICMKGKSPGDFVDCRYLCDDGWSGVQGASVATEGHKLDKSSNEIRDEINGKAKKA